MNFKECLRRFLEENNYTEQQLRDAIRQVEDFIEQKEESGRS